jgi:hypothetical protein
VQGAAYGGTYDLVHRDLKALGITATMIDTSQPCDAWAPLLQPNTKVGARFVLRVFLGGVPGHTRSGARHSGVLLGVDGAAAPAFNRHAHAVMHMCRSSMWRQSPTRSCRCGLLGDVLLSSRA